MTITDPTVLPVGTPAIVNYDNGDYNVWFHKGGGRFTCDGERISDSLGGTDMTKGDRTFTPLVPVPDGMTVEDAQQALTEHVAWVPLPGGVTEKHVGARVRHVMHDVELLGVIGRITDQGCAATPEGLNLASVEYGDWFIHPDDVPAEDDRVLDAMTSAVLRVDDSRVKHPKPSDDAKALLSALQDMGFSVVRSDA